jgi:hypothetical protein
MQAFIGITDFRVGEFAAHQPAKDQGQTAAAETGQEEHG